MDFENLAYDNAKLSILLHSDYNTIVTMKSVSKSWLGLISSNQAFWREKFEMDFGEWGGGDVDFEKEYKIEYGWRFREPRIIELETHQDRVVDVNAKGYMGVTCFVGGHLRVWDLEMMDVLYIFDNDDAQCCTAFDDDNVFVGLGNGDIHVWSLDMGDFCDSWKAHNESVICLSLFGDHLVSGDLDNVKIWETSTFECLQAFKVEGDKKLHFDGDEIICGLLDKNQVHVFHREDGLLYMLDTSTCMFCIGVNAKHIVVGCKNGVIQVWSKETKDILATLGGGSGVVKGVWCDDRKLVSVSHDGCITIWDMRPLTCIRSISSEFTHINCMDCDKGKVVLGMDYGAVFVLDYVH